MAPIVWDAVEDRIYETGVDHGVLYLADATTGAYDEAYAWNGLVSVTESPSGAESNKQYADNMVYANLLSAEEFSATIEAFTYPNEFAICDGTVQPTPGLSIGQQRRHQFGLAYRTLMGNAIVGNDFGYKLHLIYGAQAAPSEKAYTTVNDSPELITFSWEVSTTPVPVIGHDDIKPTSSITIDSTTVDPDALAALEAILYGAGATPGRLPLPAEVITLMAA
jgi:hypothetical protein